MGQKVFTNGGTRTHGPSDIQSDLVDWATGFGGTVV